MKPVVNSRQLIGACGLYCADCPLDVGHCLIYNSFISRVFGYLFNSDRAACIRYIRRYGEQAFADRMTLNEQVTMKRKK